MLHLTRLASLFLCSALAVQIAGCQHLPIGYDIDVQQGNIINQDNVQQLRIGMTREKVIEIMGEPVMVNTFNNRCWDYVYTDVSRKKSFVKNKITLIFEHDRLVKIIK